MTAQYHAAHFETRHQVAPIGHNRRAPHVFDLHPVLHIAVFGGFAVYLAIMWSAFADPGLAIPFVIFGVFLAAFFIVPALRARMAPDAGPRALWADFRREGMPTGSGHLTANAVMAQVLIMPAVMILWGLAIAVIRATV